ncbi:MAG: transporter substrate-binding domain-containing protein [bacterium]|nr:transporter substrate-binding domain-containing protein [bacterium]
MRIPTTQRPKPPSSWMSCCAPFRALLLLSLVLSGAPAAGNHAEPDKASAASIVVGGGDAYKPFHFVENGRAQGFDVDLMTAVAEAMGLDAEVQLTDWRDARDGLADGSVDVHVGMTFSQERAGEFLFSTPILSQHYRIFVREGTDRVSSDPYLPGLRIAVQKNSVMEDYVATHGYAESTVFTHSARDALILLATDKVDCVILTEYRGLQVIQDLGLDDVVGVGDPIHPSFHGFAVPARRAELMPVLNQGLALVKKSGEYDRIYDRWFGVLEGRAGVDAAYLKYVAWIVLPLLLVAVLAGLWSWSMRRQVIERTAQLQSARDRAETASEVKSRFLATMSHEIRTPLNAVLGMTEILRASELTTTQNDLVTTIQGSAMGLQEIISDILAFSRLELEDRNLDRAEFSLREVVGQVAKTMGDRAATAGLEMRTPAPTDLPDRVLGDAAAVRRIFVHLLDNAVKFTPTGGIHLAVNHEQTEDGRLRISAVVADTGVGVPEEARAGLFDAFTQADSSTTRSYGGTGLGLALCRRLVTAMGGELRHAPGPRCGSSFSFSLLLDPVVEAVEAPRETAAEAAEPVLVVEDNPVNQRVVTMLLRKWGFSSEVAGNGAEAVEACRQNRFRAIIMDCQMPVMDGLEATIAIRDLEGRDRRTPIIALTAGAAGHDRRTCLEAGMDEYLTKPVNGKKLKASLESRIAHSPLPIAG